MSKLSQPRRFWSEEDLARLAGLYPDRPAKEVARLLGRHVSSVYNAAHKLGIQKTPEFRRAHGLQKGTTTGRAHRFPKGHTPANKGLRRPGYNRGRMRETQFKKGERTGGAARNWVPIGTILPDSCGYLRIKVREAVWGKEPTGWGNPDAWPQYHRHIWRQHHGPIPPKHLIVFKDHNPKNCAIENLEMISMADNARRNSMWTRLPRELAEAIQLNGALKKKLRRLTRGKEQNG